jgi:hypothetical protein
MPRSRTSMPGGRPGLRSFRTGQRRRPQQRRRSSGSRRSSKLPDRANLKTRRRSRPRAPTATTLTAWLSPFSWDCFNARHRKRTKASRIAAGLPGSPALLHAHLGAKPALAREPSPLPGYSRHQQIAPRPSSAQAQARLLRVTRPCRVHPICLVDTCRRRCGQKVDQRLSRQRLFGGGWRTRDVYQVRALQIGW